MTKSPWCHCKEKKNMQIKACSILFPVISWFITMQAIVQYDHLSLPTNATRILTLAF